MASMTPPLSSRVPVATAAIALVVAGAVLVPAAPAAAAPVDGEVDSYAYARVAAGSLCGVPHDPMHQHRTFTPATGRRTATVSQLFTAVSKETTENGQVDNSTSGEADANHGAFNTVRFVAQHSVFIRNSEGPDCGLGVIADSQPRALLEVNHRGRVDLAWDRGRTGQIEFLVVTDPDGNNIVDKHRPAAHGDVTFRVHPGTYQLAMNFVTRLNERDVPVGADKTKLAHFKVVADYRR
ncbi:hypothetical protein F0U44_03645 [Nocardioides humilatus]|uniref:Uncharacterized protein n=1 Tax=Nocardioides humilatus TaxID=2607660 RepID=A0A5B1LLP4_9ACTN|nr:hypothetical protein [Nocardioides humilatus]KAA1421404.1 hypothetical protein F0U44_03645 [Nocardioides humilatus]